MSPSTVAVPSTLIPFLNKTEEPVTVNEAVLVRPDTVTSPRTSSFAVGLVVPIPTSALEVTTKTLPSVE